MAEAPARLPSESPTAYQDMAKWASAFTVGEEGRSDGIYTHRISDREMGLDYEYDVGFRQIVN